MGPIRGAAWIRRCFLMVDVQQLSRKSVLRVTFTPMSELRDCMVRRLPKQNRQIEEGASEDSDSQARQTRLRRTRVLGGIFGRRIASFQPNRSYIPLACHDTFPGRSARMHGPAVRECHASKL